ncbi:MAG: dTDP-4-dehydrorhamnose reductase [Desulfobacterales bacterium]|nr:dTDP-4-dehydrorhamnose reductase [Desulfobacterales bacterium]
MKILITGAKGQLGQDFKQLFEEEGISCILTDYEEIDITDFNAAKNYISKYSFDFIINCAAYNNVDKAESDWQTAYKVNGLAVRNLANIANEIKAVFVHYSTDYVFDGTKKIPYTIFDEPCPISKYGESKLLGEKMVRDIADRYFLIRLSWAFGIGNVNFVKKIIEWSNGRKELKVVNDQVSSPTYTKDIAKATFDLIKTNAYGVYHITNSKYCSRYDWAKYILDKVGWQGKLVPSPSDEFKTPAKRPEFSVLDNFGTKDIIGYDLPNWENATDRFLDELKS